MCLMWIPIIHSFSNSNSSTILLYRFLKLCSSRGFFIFEMLNLIVISRTKVMFKFLLNHLLNKDKLVSVVSSFGTFKNHHLKGFLQLGDLFRTSLVLKTHLLKVLESCLSFFLSSLALLL